MDWIAIPGRAAGRPYISKCPFCFPFPISSVFQDFRFGLRKLLDLRGRRDQINKRVLLLDGVPPPAGRTAGHNQDPVRVLVFPDPQTPDVPIRSMLPLLPCWAG